MKSNSQNFSKIFEDAENAVSGIKNEKLREIAFEKLISHLFDVEDRKSNVDGNHVNEGDVKGLKPKTKNKRANLRTSNKDNNKAKVDGPKAWIRELVDDGFFNKPKSSSDIRQELEARSHHLKASDLTLPLQSLCHEKLLRRNKIAPKDGEKAVLHWVNW